jgi:hypothetical protein
MQFMSLMTSVLSGRGAKVALPIVECRFLDKSSPHPKPPCEPFHLLADTTSAKYIHASEAVLVRQWPAAAVRHQPLRSNSAPRWAVSWRCGSKSPPLCTQAVIY